MAILKNGPAGAGAGGQPVANIFIGLGANLGDPVAKLAEARARLAALPGTVPVAHSALYRTAPVGYLEQPDFINAVCHLRTQLAPEPLVETLFALECTLGRVRDGNRDGPRIIDIDLLFYEGVTMQAAHLCLPHPRLHERGFVLYPWAELAPNLVVSGQGTIAALAARNADQRVERLLTDW
ncbi:MAG: 2-amino-4-hydroxy-6-hydroxymethyldihydropteridine diphosphokinase [Acidiferrobacter sp.]